MKEIAVAFSPHSEPSPRARVAISRAVSQPRARGIALSLYETWERYAPGVPGSSVTLAVRVAASVAERIRGTQTVELVWTGPKTTVAVRRTREALRDIFRLAERTLTLASFSTSRDDGTLEELLAAAARGIYITLILDTPVTEAKGLARDAAAVFAALKGKAAFYTWPAANRPTVQYSAMHAKTAIADSSAALISSANLSAAAMDRNMELGVLIVGEPLPRLLDQHIQELIRAGQLTALLS
jgi:cardiolipin synthase